MEKEQQPSVMIREASYDDLLKIRQMHAKSWLAAYPNDAAGVSQEWIQERVSKWTTADGIERSKEHFKDIFGNTDHFYRIAVEGEDVIGLLHGSKTDGAQHLEALYVDESQYGTGLAQRLMTCVDEWFDPKRSVDLEVVAYNKRAIKFYEKCGFASVEASEHVFAEKIPVVTMERAGVHYE